MSALPWMRLFVADYLADTGHLSTVEHGAYLLLIMHYWQNRGLPDDDAKLARIVRLNAKQWHAIRDTIAAFFGDHWQHDRINIELSDADQMHAKRSAAGQRAASARYANRSTDAQPIADQTHTPLPSPSQKKETDSQPSVGVPLAFEQPKNQSSQTELLEEEPVFLDRTGAREVVEIWNRIASPALPSVKTLTAARRALIKARANGHVPDWESAFKRAAASPFLRGERNDAKHPNWRADFDFILTEKHWVKLDEGGYDERSDALPQNNRNRGL